MRAIGYIRVSTEEQARDGVSLDSQKSKIEAYCNLYGYELIGIEVDAGVSAKSLDRPGVTAALKALSEGRADGLVITKLDRLTRSIVDWGKLVDDHFVKGSHLWSVGDSIDTTSAMGRMVLNIMMSLAQGERELIAERTQEALNHKRSKGERIGNLPYGKSLAADLIHLVDDGEDLAAIAEARRLRSEGLTFRAIAEELTGLFRTKRGGTTWAASTVHKLLALGSLVLAMPGIFRRFLGRGL